MIARVINTCTVQLEQVTPDVEDRVAKWFSAKHPNHQYIIGAFFGKNYDGTVVRYNRRKQQIAFPLLHELRNRCQKEEIPLDVEDERAGWENPNPNLINENWLPDIKLETYQIEAIRACCTNDCGIIMAPTGAGKGEIIAGVVKAHAKPTLILAEQTVVVDQLKKRLELRNVVEEVGLFYAGKTPEDKLVCIGTSASLSVPPEPKIEQFDAEEYIRIRQAWKTRSANASKYRKLTQLCDLLIVDECDRGTSSIYRKLFRLWFNGRKRFGLSATPFDKAKPVENLYVKEHFGPIIHQVDRQSVEDCGRIIPVRHIMLAVGEGGNKHEGSAFDIALSERAIRNPDFHALVARIVSAFPNDGTLILVERNELGDALEQLIPDSKFVHGQTAQRKRIEIFGEFERREIKCLIGGKIVKRGFDLKGGCENLILCGLGALTSDLLQQIGRAMRINKKGYARVFDFFFMNNRYLYKHSRERLKTVVAAGISSTVKFRAGTITGEDLIKRRFRTPTS